MVSGADNASGRAETSGVAKTTIYRHWPNRESLLLDLVDELAPPFGPIDTGSLAGDLAAAARELAATLGDTAWSRALPGLLDAAQRDPELCRIVDAAGRARRQVVLDALERARQRGELAEGVDPQVAAALLAGPLFYCRLVLRRQPDEAFVDGVVEGVLRSLVRRS